MSTSTPGSEGRIRAFVGTAGDDRIVVETGTITVGAGGKDTFVLTSAGLSGQSERLGAITDYVAGDDILDLTRLGAKAAILGEGRMIDGSTRLSIDYDGDGQEDGYLYVGGAGFIPADDNFHSPMPIIDGEVHILPFPMPGAPIPKRCLQAPESSRTFWYGWKTGWSIRSRKASGGRMLASSSRDGHGP